MQNRKTESDGLGLECFMAHPDHRPRPRTAEEREQEALKRLESSRVRYSAGALWALAIGIPVAIGLSQYLSDPLREFLLRVVLHFS